MSLNGPSQSSCPGICRTFAFSLRISCSVKSSDRSNPWARRSCTKRRAWSCMLAVGSKSVEDEKPVSSGYRLPRPIGRHLDKTKNKQNICLPCSKKMHLAISNVSFGGPMKQDKYWGREKHLRFLGFLIYGSVRCRRETLFRHESGRCGGC